MTEYDMLLFKEKKEAGLTLFVMWGLNCILKEKSPSASLCGSAVVQPVAQGPNKLPVLLGPF